MCTPYSHFVKIWLKSIHNFEIFMGFEILKTSWARLIPKAFLAGDHRQILYKFERNPSRTFWVILHTNKQPNYCVVEIRAWILEVACCKFSSKFTPLHLHFSFRIIWHLWNLQFLKVGKNRQFGILQFYSWLFYLSGDSISFQSRSDET